MALPLLLLLAAGAWAGADASWERRLGPAAARLLELPAPAHPLLRDPSLKPLEPARIPGSQAGRVFLPGLLDRHRDLLNRRLGALDWDISAAADAGVKTYFFTFARPGKLVIAPMGDIGRLQGEGINATVAPGVVYNFKISPNLFDPVRASKLKITPASGTAGPSHEVKTGVLVDALKARAYVFNAGRELWLVHGTDVDPATNTLAKTRSLMFIHMNGMDSKAWPLAEESLPPGKAVSADLDGTRLILIRGADGWLTIHKD